MITGRRVFITGGAGFIGSTLAASLVERNEVILYDNLHRDARPGMLPAHPNLRLVEGDILDGPALRRAMAGAGIVVHCAAICGVDTVLRNRVRTMQVNMVGSANVLEAAAGLAQVERVMCFSTSEVCGRYAFQAEEGQGTTLGPAGEGRWTYAVSKLATEHLALACHQEQGLPVTILRPFNVYGPGQVGEGALRTFIRRARAGLPLEVHGDGTQIRAWCYVDDMVEALLIALEHPAAVGECFNIGNPRAVVTIYGLAETVLRVTGSPSPIVFVRKDYTDVELRIPSVTKARSLLGFEARIDLEEGIRRTAAWMQSTAG